MAKEARHASRIIIPNPQVKEELSDEERQLVRLVTEYETARSHAAMARIDDFPLAERQHREARRRIGRALHVYGRAFLWAGWFYRADEDGQDVERTRGPEKGTNLWRGVEGE